jgi:DNA-binding MarR family transcriptional regulator
MTMSALTPNQFTILEALKDGPCWMRSFQTVKPLVEDLLARELVERCRPHLGRGRNMIRLTAKGCDLIEIEPAVVPEVKAPEPFTPKPQRELGEIKADAPPETRRMCEEFRRRIRLGEDEKQIVADLAAQHDVQRPAIWKRLRSGGIVAEYAPRREGGKGRPVGGGVPGYTAERRRKSHDHSEARACVLAARQPPVDRDPCPRCGVRGDVGCGHSRAPLGMTI